MSIAKYFDDMSYGPSPESDAEARSWLAQGAAVEGLSAGNMKCSFVDRGRVADWADASAEGEDWLRRATEVKNIRISYGA